MLHRPQRCTLFPYTTLFRSAKEINAATKLQRVEDLYRPYRKKRRTRATVAKEKGLEPLAKEIYEQTLADVQSEAKQYISEEHELASVEDVLAGKIGRAHV